MRLRKYGVATTVDGIPLITLGSMDFKANPTLAAGDITVEVDGVEFGNIDTMSTLLPASGNSLHVVLSIAEMTGKIVVVTIIDQTSPKEWEDQRIIIETYGHPSAQHPDMGSGWSTGT